jgi:hypothetical protein
VTTPQSKPPPDVLTRLITRLEQQLARRDESRSRVVAGTREAHLASPARDLETYLTQRIEKALAPLRTLLDEHDVSFIGAMLRERLATDPSLSRLVRRLAKVSVGDRDG